MPSFRYRERESSNSGLILSLVAGAVAGFAVGVLVAQRGGGLAGITARLRRVRNSGGGAPLVDEYDDDSSEAYEAAEFEDLDAPESLEERVLEAFTNDPILSERAIDIGEIGDNTIELAGWVDTDEEAVYAVTVARGVPGVSTVVNRLAIGEEEARMDDTARRVAEGDPALTEARWEGQQVGTGRRRQGTSQDVDRHADPKVALEERWLSEREALRNAAEETEGLAERRRSAKQPPKGDRTGGSPVAPTGVPKGDHVAKPLEADESRRDAGNIDQTDRAD